MQYYVIKREDASNQSCPYWKSENTWTSRLADAWQFDCPYEAEFERKRRKTDGRSWVSQVTVREDEVELSFSVKPVIRGRQFEAPQQAG